MEEIMPNKVLGGHTSQETAFVVDDYPYGFRLRCKIRYWLEFKPRHGFRFVSQTTNPKREGEVWNKPKASTYKPLAVMFLDEKEHVRHWAISYYDANEQTVAQFERLFGSSLDQSQQKALGIIKEAVHRVAAIRKQREHLPLSGF